jgi:hypothetical protein
MSDDLQSRLVVADIGREQRGLVTTDVDDVCSCASSERCRRQGA